MTTTGDVQITILDGGAAVVVPGASVQVVIGTATAGTAATVVATQSADTLASNFTGGLLPEAAALSVLAGGTVLAMRAATVTAGAIRGASASPITITGATNATPIVITAAAHGLITGAVVTVAGVGGNTAANGTFKITKVSSSTFSLDNSVGTGIYTSGGTAQPLGLNQIGTGTSVITASGTPVDDFYIKLLVVTGGTRGTAGITFKVSYDAGRHYGPTLSLGTATTYALTGTGVTLAFSAGTLVAGDYVTLGTTAPATDTAGVIACLNALKASPYGATGWGSMHVLGEWTGADADTINTALDGLADTDFLYTRMISTARDASPPVIYGGTGEDMTTYIAALQTGYSAVDAKRLCANGGFYNMPSAFPKALAGAPSYRRPLSFALAQRQVTIPPQRHAGRVRDGALAAIVVDPTSDPSDGFLYYDNRIQSGLDSARFCCARTRVGLPGYYIVNPNLMSPLGSVFTMLPLGNVMDVACGIVHQVGQQDINSDVRLNANGTLYENEALAIEANMYGAIFTNMIATSEISSASVTVNRSWNVAATSIVKIAVVIQARGYILEEDIDIGFQNPFAAG